MIKSPYSVRIHENTDQRKLRILTVFTQCVLVLCVTKNVLNNVLFLIYRFERFAKPIPQHLCFVCLANLNTDTLKVDYGNCKRKCSLKVLFKYSCRSNACRFFKNGLRHRCFPCEYCKIFKNSIYTEHLCRWLLLQDKKHCTLRFLLMNEVMKKRFEIVSKPALE